MLHQLAGSQWLEHDSPRQVMRPRWRHRGRRAPGCVPGQHYASQLFAGPGPSTQTSRAAPGLCASSDGLFITWAGTGNNKLNVAPVDLDQFGRATGIGKPVTLDQTSPGAPALASLNGALYLAWTGTNNELNIMTSTDAGATFGSLVTSTQTSPAAPALSRFFPGRALFIAWAGTGNNELNWEGVDMQAGVATGID